MMLGDGPYVDSFAGDLYIGNGPHLICCGFSDWILSFCNVLWTEALLCFVMDWKTLAH